MVDRRGDILHFLAAGLVGDMITDVWCAVHQRRSRPLQRERRVCLPADDGTRRVGDWQPQAR